MNIISKSIFLSICLTVNQLYAQALNSPIPTPQPQSNVSQSNQEQVPEGNSIPEYSDVEILGPAQSSSQRPGTLRNIPSQTGEYIIVKGDTLWDICDRLLDNPWYWPKLWKLNTYIENPHLIYPGDKLYFDEGSNRSFPDMGFSDKDGSSNSSGSNNGNLDDEGAIFSDSTVVYQEGSKVALRPVYFLAERKLDIKGKITHALANKRELTENDTIYIKMSDSQGKPKKGDRFYVIEEISELHERQYTNAGKLYGNIIRKNAVIEVKSVGSTTIEAVIISSDHSVNRGFKLIEYEPQIVSFDIEESKQRVEAKILGVTRQQIMIRDGDYVFVNQGEKSTLKPGTILYAVRRGDPLVSKKENEGLPEITYGKLVVIEVYEKSSLAYVTDVRAALEVGEVLKTFVE